MRSERPHPIQAVDSTLLVIDVQERLAPAMEPALYTSLRTALIRLGEAQTILGFETKRTEQYSKGLGPTVPEVQQAFAAQPVFEKLHFSAVADPEFRAALIRERLLRGSRRDWTWIIAGMETHICVYQTVRDLIAEGHSVYVLADATAARTRLNHDVGLELCRGAGARVSSTEAVLFDMLGQAGSDAFRAIARLIR